MREGCSCSSVASRTADSDPASQINAIRISSGNFCIYMHDILDKPFLWLVSLNIAFLSKKGKKIEDLTEIFFSKN